jgi:hypothetical protein
MMVMPYSSKKNNDQAVIYIGPSVPGHMLQRYAVFRGDLHSSINEFAAKVPAVKRLIVNVNEMAAAELKLADKSSVYYQMFAEVLKHIKEVKL